MPHQHKKGLTAVQRDQADVRTIRSEQKENTMTVQAPSDRRQARLIIELASKVALTILVAGLGWLAMSSLLNELILGMFLWFALAIGWRRAVVRERRAARIARLWALRAYATVEALHVELGEEVAA